MSSTALLFGGGQGGYPQLVCVCCLGAAGCGLYGMLLRAMNDTICVQLENQNNELMEAKIYAEL